MCQYWKGNLLLAWWVSILIHYYYYYYWVFRNFFQKAVWNPKFVWNRWYHYHRHHCGVTETVYCTFFVLLVKCVLCVFVLYWFLSIYFCLLWRFCYWPISCLFGTLMKITAVNLIIVFVCFMGQLYWLAQGTQILYLLDFLLKMLRVEFVQLVLYCYSPLTQLSSLILLHSQLLSVLLYKWFCARYRDSW